jgi:hypothetical protein
MIDLYSKKLPEGALEKLCIQVRDDAKTISDKDNYFLPDVCAEGKVIPLMAMNNAFPVVFLLQSVLDE